MQARATDAVPLATVVRAAVADLHDARSRRHVAEQQTAFRKAGAMFDLVAALLRLLEFTAGHVPGAFLGPEPATALNLSRWGWGRRARWGPCFAERGVPRRPAADAVRRSSGALAALPSVAWR